ncbi:hypothetical protein AVEN_31451-1 [Araneus ventricosus]|uniref:Uncharacterized protein n=1 Tax=Araneus ventricosus TaxID=182803 RepID=A0A4Y2QVJ5_ARAVE|nr:hypothetical protein AVEN_31451-1 [Araneus ventricosus]
MSCEEEGEPIDESEALIEDLEKAIDLEFEGDIATDETFLSTFGKGRFHNFLYAISFNERKKEIAHGYLWRSPQDGLSPSRGVHQST